MTMNLSGFKSHGIREPLTNRIRGILEEYPDGTQIARELLQNSDDARSTVQWYLLDHHSYIDNTDNNDNLQLFDEGLKEYMGPAFLAGSDSVFEEKDFKSMKNLAASEKRDDETKIGQMGIGFNSIYHMTDCPSFISGDQLMIIEPHERIFNGIKSDFNEGAVRGSFVEEGVGLETFPDQLKAFSVLEDIDFTTSYPGTIFRFPLKTEKQALVSDISKKAYSVEKVLEMLRKLESEALKAMLFLKHIEKISIYERKSLEEGPIKLFEIEIVNAEEVRKERQALLGKLREHAHPDADASSETILEYSVRPIFRITQRDGSTAEQNWLISTLVGNVKRSREYMKEKTDDNLDAHRLIPWVGIAAPSEPKQETENPGLFCFLPISIKIPFPVHINGHFAVEKSRRAIWTNQDNIFARDSAAYLKSVWNVHLFQAQVPNVYAKFLEDLGPAREQKYDLWPISCSTGNVLDEIWKDLLSDVLRVMFKDNLKVFFCEYGDQEHQQMTDYTSSWIAGRDIDRYPLLVKSLQRLTKVVVGLPDAVLETVPKVINSLDFESRILTPAIVRKLLREHKDTWSSEGVVSSETRIEMLRYCIGDDDIEDLEGLPLLPLAGDLWVEFNVSRADERYLVNPNIYSILSYSNDGLVDIEFDKHLCSRPRHLDGFHIYWSSITNSVISSKIWDTYDRLLYNDTARTGACMPQPDNGFPTTEWILDFWIMVRSLSNQDQSDLLSKLKGLHLLPTTYQKLAPLSIQQPVVYLDNSKDTNRSTLVPFLKILDDHLDCRVMREDSGNWVNIAASYVFEISDAHKILDILSNAEEEKLDNLDQDHRRIACQYMSQWLSVESDLDGLQLRTLKMLPIYQTYDESSFISIAYHESNQSHWRVVSGFSHSENPWLPKSVELLADGQPMYQHLIEVLDAPTMKESGYWFDILENLDQFSEDEWDAIIEKFCGKYHVHCKDHDYRSILIDLPFVRVTGPRSSKDVNTDSTSLSRRSPREIVHPTFSSLFAEDEIVFPAGVYAESSILDVLTQIGIRSKFNGDFIMDRVKSLSNHARTSGVNSVKDVLQAFYVQLNSSFSDDFSGYIKNSLCEKPWIIANGSSSDQLCYSPMECRPETERALIGLQMPLTEFQFTNKALIECMGWDQLPPLDKVLANLLSIIEQARNGDSEPDGTTFIEIYRYLMKHINNHEALSAMKGVLDSQPWILVNGTLHPTDRVALNISFDLAPHFVQIRSPGLEKLFLAMGVRQEVVQKDLEGIISKVASRYGDEESLSDTDAELVLKVLKFIAIGDTYFSDKLQVLTQDNRLRLVNEVVYDDLSQRRNPLSEDYDEDSYTFASDRIRHAVAETLGIPMFSARYLSDQRDTTFEPWAQEENIGTRIKNLLNDYDPSSLFSEFLQNAADAGATKISFMLDQRTFGKNNLFSDEMAAWQGPALVIYNDAEFSESDFKALTDLGVGNKRGDSSKIGRNGVGFNSVYHITDVPSVVSGSYVGFFDPMRDNLPKGRSSVGAIRFGGLRYNFLNFRRGDAFSEQLDPYKGLFGCDMKSHFQGTIFRIPLRVLDTDSNKTPRKHVTNKQWTPLDVHDMLMKWVGEAKVGMLFLDSIRTITFAIESAQGNDFLCSFEKSFVNEKSLLIDALQKGNDTSNATNVIDISTSNSKAKKESQRWLVHTDHGYPENTGQDIRNIAAGNRWRPHSGIAFLIGNSPKKEGNSSEKDGNSSKKERFFGRLFVHLPTPITTQLPFHIHGGFALTSDRKNFAGETDATDSHKWNEFMMRDRLPQTALAAMEKLLILKFHGLEKSRSHQIDLIGATETYFEFWPIKAQSRFNLFVQILLHMSYNRQVYPVRVLKQDSTDVNVRFLSGREVEFPELTGASTKIKDTICDYLRKKGVNICDCPQDIQTRLRNEWREIIFPAINEDRIRRIIREDPAFIPYNFSKTIQRNSTGLSELRWILEYVLKVILDPRANPRIPVTGLCLLPLMNNAWIPLAPLCGRYTINPRMRNLIRGEEYLVDQSVFESTPETSQIGLIFERLCSIYGITQLSPSLFVSIFNSENPEGVTEQQRGELWGLLRDTQSFDAYGELPILMTSTGRNVQLKFYGQGIDISQFDFQRRIRLQTISALATELGLVIFDATQNYQNSYLISVARAVTDSKILSHISRECSRLPASRLISRGEAEVLQQMIKADITLNINELAQLGLLRIWPSWDLTNAQSSLLIPARGSYFIHGSYTLEHFGGATIVIRSATNHRFKEMGAISLDPLCAAQMLVIPRFLDGTLSFNNYQTKTAYINLLWEIIGMQRIYYSNGHSTHPATTFLSQDTVLLGRDGILHHSQELLNPDDDLLTLIFDGEPSKFPDNQLWQTLRNSPERSLLKIPSMGDTNVIRECALHVLSLIDLNIATSQSATRTKANNLIQHIYGNYCNIDWMSPEWRIVPAKVTRDPPYDECVPDFPKFMSFSELIDPSFHEVCWTQHAFFPKNLAPSGNFKANYPSVGKPKTEAVIKHLSVLASLAPKWTSIERREYLKKCAIAVYKFLNEVLKRGPAEVELLKRELKAMKDPFILNGDKWLWPAQILLDVDNGTDRNRVVHDDLLVVREFLLIAGVGEMKTVDNIVIEIPEGRSKGYIEDQLFHSFEHQDQRGFMDVLFRFENGKEIRAHKVMLIHANEHFKSMFEGPWAEFIERDSTNLDIQIIDLSNIQNKDQNETFEAFWGLIYYFYKDEIIPTNGPPAPSTVPETAADEDVDPLVARVQFLIELLCLSNLYQAPRLKKLIASEIIRGGKTIYGNVFSVNKYAALYESSELKEYCEKFVRTNATSMRASISHEIQDLIKKMAGLGDSDKVMREKLMEEIKELGENLGELDILNA